MGAFGSTQGFTMGFGEKNQVSSNGEASVARRKRDEPPQTCLPVTIRLIETAISQRVDDGTSAELKLHGAEHGMLILVAVVEAITKKETSMELALNDSTGRIKARFYTHGQQPEEYDGIVPGWYVYLFGNVRTSPMVHFAVIGMRLVSSANEISYHMIESAYAALKLQKDLVQPMTPTKRILHAEKESDTMMATDITPAKVPEPSTMAVATLMPSAWNIQETNAPVTAPKVRLEGTGLRNAILAFIRSEGEGKAEGIALATISVHVDPTPTGEVRNALGQLVAEGEIFTTLDDDHFQIL